MTHQNEKSCSTLADAMLRRGEEWWCEATRRVNTFFWKDETRPLVAELWNLKNAKILWGVIRSLTGVRGRGGEHVRARIYEHNVNADLCTLHTFATRLQPRFVHFHKRYQPFATTCNRYQPCYYTTLSFVQPAQTNPLPTAGFCDNRTNNPLQTSFLCDNRTTTSCKPPSPLCNLYRC